MPAVELNEHVNYRVLVLDVCPDRGYREREGTQSCPFVGVAVDWIVVVMRKRVSVPCQMRGYDYLLTRHWCQSRLVLELFSHPPQPTGSTVCVRIVW